MAIPMVSWISSVCLHIYIYCIFWIFGCLNSNLNYGYIKYTSNFLEENTLRCETPETMHVILGRTVHLGTLSAHRRLDLHLRCCQRWQKIKKMAKTWHGLMICDVYTQNIQILAYQAFGSWVLHNHVPPKTWRWDLHALLFGLDGSTRTVSARSIANFQILAPRISRSILLWRDDPTDAIGWQGLLQRSQSSIRVQRCPAGFWRGFEAANGVFRGLTDIQMSITNSIKN
jgi:hypothetical protein